MPISAILSSAGLRSELMLTMASLRFATQVHHGGERNGSEITWLPQWRGEESIPAQFHRNDGSRRPTSGHESIAHGVIIDSERYFVSLIFLFWKQLV